MSFFKKKKKLMLLIVASTKLVWIKFAIIASYVDPIVLVAIWQHGTNIVLFRTPTEKMLAPGHL